MIEYKINHKTLQTNCFWFEPKRLCKHPDGNLVCREKCCPVLIEEIKVVIKKSSHAENCFSKYEKYGQAFIDDSLEIEDINKFELFQVYKDFLQAIKSDLKERKKNGQKQRRSRSGRKMGV